jgi:hypothetical protein
MLDELESIVWEVVGAGILFGGLEENREKPNSGYPGVRAEVRAKYLAGYESTASPSTEVGTSLTA